MKIIYFGLFLNMQIDGTLERKVNNQHITICYEPTEKQINEIIKHLGEEYTFPVDGYGISNENEGILVSEAGKLSFYHGSKNPHITISLSRNGLPKNTGDITFKSPIPSVPKIITGKLGFYSNDNKVYFCKL